MAVVTKTLKSTGGDYSLMSTWESTEQTNLVTDGDSHVLECYNDWPSGLSDYVTVTGWTTDATNFITITAPSGERHDGVPGAGFSLTCNQSFGYPINATQSYTIVEFIEAENLSTSTDGGVFYRGSDGQIRNCIGSRPTAGTQGSAYLALATGENAYFVNCLALGVSTSTGFGSRYAGSAGSYNPYNADNCTAIGCGYGFVTGGAGGSARGLVRNCVAYSTSIDFGYTFLSSSATNASGDTTAPGTSPVTGITSAVFKDYASGHYQPADGGLLHGAGTDLSLGTDIRGETITDISIGAYDNDTLLRTLKSTLGDYALISTWESNEQQDLTASGNRAVLECDGGDFSGTNCVINGWTTSSVNTITIKAAAGHEHNGVRRSNGGSGAVIGAFYDLTGYCRFYDIEFISPSSSVSFISSGNGIYRGLIVYSLLLDTGHVVEIAAGDVAENLLVINASVARTGIQTNGNAEVRNCTVINTQSTNYCFIPSATGTHKNNVSYSTGGAEWSGSGGTDSNNASSDGSHTGTSGQTITTAAFKDYASGHYQPAEGGLLHGAGTDLSLGTDIRGETITDISIGAYDNDILLRTLKSTLGDYALMSTWESTEQQDLTASGNRAVLECYNDWPSGLDDTVVVTGWTTDATNFVTIRAASGEGHGGVPGAGFWIGYTADLTDFILDLSQEYSVVEDLEVVNTFTGFGSTDNYAIARYSTARNCIGSSPNLTGGTVITFLSHFNSAADVNTFVNCLSHDCGSPSVRSFYGIYRGEFLNCTSIGTGLGRGFDNFNAVDKLLAKNCVALNYDSDSDFYNGTGSWVAGSTNNASGDTTAPGTSPVTGVVITDGVDFVSPSTGDYHPTSTGNLAGAATDLSAEFLDDITGTLR